MADKTELSTFLEEKRRYEPPKDFVAKARIGSRERYEKLYRESLDSPGTFWKRELSDLVLRTPWRELLEWKDSHARWFEGATLNITESCLDRFIGTKTEKKPAIIWEGEPEGQAGEQRTLTYGELHAQVTAFAAALAQLGVSKGDRVMIYMGMVPEVVVAMLACARLGAPHSVVFGGFAADSLRDRVNDCGAKIIVTQDGGWRRGNVVPLKATVDQAVQQTPTVKHVVVLRRLGEAHVKLTMKPGRDIEWDEALKAASGRGPDQATVVDAEHPLFILYTSGSTGKPKGVLHTTLGYLAGAHVTTKYVFDLRDDDVYWCTADVGWVTGHSYIVYGPLSNGATCLMYEGAPATPDWGRLFRMIDRHKVTVFYTAPTAIRAFIRAGNDWVDKRDLSSLRLLGSVGEPINPEAWVWYHEHVGRGRCPIVDTWWQTETGSILLTTLPGAVAAKPGSTGLPFFGVEPDVVTKDGQSVGAGAGGMLILKRPWPSMLRTARRRRLLHGRRAHRRRAERRRPPHRHGGDRERDGVAPRGGGSGGRGAPGRPEGPGARRLRHPQAGPRGGR